MSTEHLWNDNDREKTKFRLLYKNMSQCHFEHYKFNMVGLGLTAGLRAKRQATHCEAT
jgi:hypothetical protein